MLDTHTQLCHTPSFTHNFVTHHLSHTIFHTQLCHTQLCHTPSFTHNFVTHYLSHTIFTHNFVTHNFVTYHLSHTTLLHTIFHTPSFTHNFVTHNFVTHHLSHTRQTWIFEEIHQELSPVTCNQPRQLDLK